MSFNHKAANPNAAQMQCYIPIHHTSFPPPDLAGIDPGDQELGRLISSLISIGAMGRQNNERAVANQVAALAVHPETVGRVVGDLAVVLLVLGPAVEDNTLDLLADGGAALGDGGTGEGGTLAVATGDDLGLGAERVGADEEALHLVNGGGGGALGEEVVEEAGGVGTANTLDPDVGLAKGSVESDTSWAAERSLLAWLAMVHLANRQDKTHKVTTLGGTAGVDEDDLGARAAIEQFVGSRTSTRLPATSLKGLHGLAVRLDKLPGANLIERARESRDESAGEGGDGSEETHVDGFVERL